jgi:hypothetical protein
MCVGMDLGKSGYIDEETVSHVDPPGVDDVCAVAALALPDPGVDVEEVGALDGAVVGDVGVEGLVMDFAEVMERGVGDLGVEVVVPWEALYSLSSVCFFRMSSGNVFTFPFHHHPSSVPCAIQVSSSFSRKKFR